MRVPNKVNTKPFERLWKWKRKENVFDFKGRRRKGKSVLFLSVRRIEIETNKVPFYREKEHQNKAIKVVLSAKVKRGSKPTNLLLSQTERESRMGKCSYWHSTTPKRKKKSDEMVVFCLFFTAHQQDMCFQTQRCSK